MAKNTPKKKAILPLIDDMVAEYHSLREESKRIKSRMDTLAKAIKEYATKNGTKDDKGSFYCDNGAYTFGSQAKKSVSFDVEKALEFFKTNGLTDAVKTKEVIDEDAVSRYIEEDKISFEDLEGITKTNVSFAIDLKKKEDMPVVEETTFAVAASTKPKKPKLSVKKG